ncbi:flagellar motor protein MotD [Aromatoleum bremense]|uniref:Flagellar motor protein MotD n=1 Tax=Aromatoleum bremense TaxID=76115 RepID=A0ABX1NZX6_9RHOO|nr:flagellar motor protein MotD [Aromatoleum bremense]NMG17291.1 flagellar motor protein MotD [Aromatoleum bremense]QTQ33070.1 Flagellar motor rotation protein MotB [Aromatoleum bremense]
MSRRRPPDEDYENHERWLVSYADFITLLFAFFVVMYSLSSVNEGKYRVLSDSLVSAFRSGAISPAGGRIIAASIPAAPSPPVVRPVREPAAEARREAEMKRINSMADEIRRVLQPLTAGGQVSVAEGVHGITVEINASVLFAPGDATLGASAVAVLQAVAQVLAGADFPITVQGHTDSVPIGTGRFPSNWELSSVRASSVVRLFIDAGVRGDRLTAAGYADQRPLTDNANEEGRARNRRVTILIESMLGDPVPRSPGRIRAGDPIRSIMPEGTEARAEPAQ